MYLSLFLVTGLSGMPKHSSSFFYEQELEKYNGVLGFFVLRYV